MYTVGLIDVECIKTYSYESLEEAKKELKYWRSCFKANNVVERNITTVDRNDMDEIESVKVIFKVKHRKDCIMFLSKNR